MRRDFLPDTGGESLLLDQVEDGNAAERFSEPVQEKKIRLLIGSFSVDCRSDDVDPMTKGMLMMWGVFAEMERDIISQRVKSGMKNAIAKGKKVGRPVLTVSQIPEKFWKHYGLYNEKKITISEYARLLSCSRTTIYKYLALIEKKQLDKLPEMKSEI